MQITVEHTSSASCRSYDEAVVVGAGAAEWVSVMHFTVGRRATSGVNIQCENKAEQVIIVVVAINN